MKNIEIVNTDKGVNIVCRGGVTLNGEEILTINKLYRAVYLSVDKTSPASFLGGTWEELPSGYALWTTSTISEDAEQVISAGLPNVTGEIDVNMLCHQTKSSGIGALKYVNGGSLGNVNGSASIGYGHITFDANSGAEVEGVYGNSTTVQPPAYKLYAWKRIS